MGPASSCFYLLSLYFALCIIGLNAASNSAEKKAKQCAKKPCVRGLCKDLDNDFACVCPLGFTGKTCKDTYCSAYPCKKGKCMNLAAGRLCKCSNPLSSLLFRECDSSSEQPLAGSTLQKQATTVDACASNPCANGGTCTDVGDSFSCYCADGWTGTDCTTRDYCNPSPCLNGQCANNPDGSGCTCTCISGWIGTNCDQCAFCTPSKCVQGLCETAGTQCSCSCYSGWNGTYCDNPILTDGGY